MNLFILYSWLTWLVFLVSFSSFFVVIFFGFKLSSNGSLIFIYMNSLTLLLISLFFFLTKFLSSDIIDYSIGSWFSTDLINISYGFRVDQLTSTMLVIISTISLFAQLYSIEYMYFDPHKTRFFSFLSLFTFFMFVLVCSNNLFFVFIGWEGVGICSYLLINFWYFRVQSNKSSILAVTINKIGDLAFLIAIACTQSFSKSTDYIIFNNISIYIQHLNLKLFFNEIIFIYILDLDKNMDILSILTLFFIIACVGKSAQFGLHLWLPEAMEGPTPVSSLIHAATMVTAGIYLTLRVSYLFKFSPTSLILILLIGSMTTLFAASVGIVQLDIKKIVAYSTCSQLGYMFMGCGYKGYNFVIFHLFIHAFFKALLFLTAGYIIHLLVNEQDTRKMGGLLKISKLSYIATSIGSLALIGFPFFSGFYSKEKIIEELNMLLMFFSRNINYYDNVIFISTLFSYSTLILTILYSFKVFSEIFFGKFNGFKNSIINILYSEYFIVIPIFLLSILSIYTGFLFNNAFIGINTDFWFNSFLLENRFFSTNNIFIPNISKVLLGPIFFYINNTLVTICCFDSFFKYEYVKTYFLIFNLISEFEWIHNQWIIPFWTFYYLFCIFFVRYFFFFETRCYIFQLIFYNRISSYFYDSLVNKYLYINRLLIIPFIYKVYYYSYNISYKIIEKGLLEQLGGYGIYYTLNKIFNFKIYRQTFLIYHYLGLIIISVFSLLFFLFYLI